MRRFALSALVAAVLLAAPTAKADEYITNAADIVKAADWKAMETITVTMGEDGDSFHYMPEEIKLKAGQPYKLELINKGKKKHYFTAPEFYKSIATRKVQSNKDGEIKAPYLLALEMMADGGQLDLYFVPVNKGTFDVYCTIDDHREKGMEGVITVE